jgi:polyhydroxybutyrate depolymerase
MIKHPNVTVVAAGPLVVWLALACDSTETPVTPGSTGGSATGGTSSGGSAVGGTSSGGKATGGTQSTGGTSTGGSATGGTSGGATGTPGCNGNKTPPTSPSNGYLTINVNGASRTYVLELSTAYDGTTPQPVIFTLHGTGTTAQEYLGSGYGDMRKGIGGRAIIVGLQGLSRNGQTGWAGNSDSGIEQVDFDFFDAVWALLKANYCVDPGRVFATGHSAGAMFSNQLGCERSTVLRGVGPFAGGGPSGNCGGKVAAFIGHNPNETLVVWSSMGWPTVEFWRDKNGCSEPTTMPTAPYPGDGATGNPLPCKTMAGCDPNYPLMLCLYQYSDQWDGNHAFPVQWGGKTVTDFFLGLPKV